jgi:hypothetical protein
MTQIRLKTMTTQATKNVQIEAIENTLMDMINKVEEGLKKGTLSLEYSATANQKPTLERVLADMDPDLMALRRELENAKSQKALMQQQGAKQDDPMLDMIVFQIESAESAHETRLLELREDDKLMDLALITLKQEDAWFQWALERRKTIEDNRLKMIREEQELKALKRELEKKKKSGWSFIAMLMGLNVITWIAMQRRLIAQKIDAELKLQRSQMLNYAQSAA